MIYLDTLYQLFINKILQRQDGERMMLNIQDVLESVIIKYKPWQVTSFQNTVMKRFQVAYSFHDIQWSILNAQSKIHLHQLYPCMERNMPFWLGDYILATSVLNFICIIISLLWKNIFVSHLKSVTRDRILWNNEDDTASMAVIKSQY